MNGLIIFDLDGTLLRSHEHICPAARDTQSALGLPVTEVETIRAMIGETSAGFYRKLAPQYGDMDGFISLFRAKERAALAQRGKLYDGVAELLAALHRRGFMLAVCSNAGKEYIELALAKTEIRGLFQTVVSARDYASKAQAVQTLADTASCSNIIMVGDTSHDFIAAADTLIPFIAVGYGYGALDGADGVHFHAETADDVLPLVNQITLFARISARIRQAPGVRSIGVDGVDTSGKSTFADRFAAYLRSTGVDAAVVHLDDFHNPKALRRQGRSEIEAYVRNAFDLETLANELLIPLRHHGEVHKTLTLLDLDRDTHTLKRRYDIGRDTLVILEGVLLYREPIADLIDYKIYLDIGFDEALRRASARDVPKYGGQILDRYRQKYIPVQQLYIDTYKPKEKCDIIVDNTDPGNPFINSLV
ncbi:MAG: HAD hydrolase-like protein [Clostridiales bacterium]|nr:HAD hydrolase-like protein [Clostridiales bacterium]